MKGINITEVFCEILSGVAIMFYVIPFLDLIGVSYISQSFAFIAKNLSMPTIFGVLILAYIIGLVMDAIGLAVGECFLDSLLCKVAPTKGERAAFWKNVSSHVLGYHDTQWAYISAYRNLAILTVPGGLLWCWFMGNNYSWVPAIAVLLGVFILEFAFLKSIAVLLRIYVEMIESA